MISNKKDIELLLEKNRDRIESFGVNRLGLFGSFVRSGQDSGSDIDFLVEFDKGKKTYDNFIHLIFLLENLLEHHVEVVTAESISPYIKPHIMKEVEYVISGK